MYSSVKPPNHTCIIGAQTEPSMDLDNIAIGYAATDKFTESHSHVVGYNSIIYGGSTRGVLLGNGSSIRGHTNTLMGHDTKIEGDNNTIISNNKNIKTNNKIIIGNISIDEGIIIKIYCNKKFKCKLISPIISIISNYLSDLDIIIELSEIIDAMVQDSITRTMVNISSNNSVI